MGGVGLGDCWGVGAGAIWGGGGLAGTADGVEVGTLPLSICTSKYSARSFRACLTQGREASITASLGRPLPCTPQRSAYCVIQFLCPSRIAFLSASSLSERNKCQTFSNSFSACKVSGLEQITKSVCKNALPQSKANELPEKTNNKKTTNGFDFIFLSISVESGDNGLSLL